MTIRTFIAINCPCEIQYLTQRIQNHFKPHNSAWRWVAPENIHLTLRFLGNIDKDNIQALSKAMTIAVEGQTAFSLSVQGLGCFPHQTRPRVLWMGIHDPVLILPSLHRRLTQSLSHLGFPPDSQPFRPHVTLARKRMHGAKDALQNLLETYRACQFGTITVDQIHLYQSQLRRNGAIHSILKSVDL